MNSFNHYSFGAVMEWMYRHMAGIQALEPAFESVALTPKPDTRTDAELPCGQERITYVKASYKSVNGLIVSEWKLENGVLQYNCETPVNATLYLPIIGEKTSFAINNTTMNISDFETVDGCIAIDLEKGSYSFVI